MIENFLNLFRKKIIIPLVRRGVPTGQWCEVYKNDKYYKVLVRQYGLPLPQQIEVEPVEENVTSKTK
jgi:hypothetical protein